MTGFSSEDAAVERGAATDEIGVHPSTMAVLRLDPVTPEGPPGGEA